MPSCEDIEIDYLTWKSEQNRLTTKYDIMRLLVLLVKHSFMTMEEDNKKFKITCQWCNSFETCKGGSG